MKILDEILTILVVKLVLPIDCLTEDCNCGSVLLTDVACRIGVTDVWQEKTEVVTWLSLPQAHFPRTRSNTDKTVMRLLSGFRDEKPSS